MMIKIKNNKLIIVIDSTFPEEDLHNLNESLLDLLSSLNDESVNFDSVYHVIQFLKNIQPSMEQLKAAREASSQSAVLQ